MHCGLKQIEITDHRNDLTVSAKVLYPSTDQTMDVSFGPYTMHVAENGTLADGTFPLLLISHGSGGTPLVYRDMAMHLAKSGYVVVMPDHPGNNRLDNALADSDKNLILRPYHLHLLIDQITSLEFFGASIVSDKIGVIGHSMGGYTALALAGGIPWTKEGVRLEVQVDRRIAALVLFAPAAGWFFPGGSLNMVDIPISLWMASEDHLTPAEWSSEIVLKGVPDKSRIEFHLIEGGGHYSFLSPFPMTMKRPDFPPSQDPPGFDREKFHGVFTSEVEGFLNRTLK